jgi:glycosyltransferase involved in cell wall biosynthesis
MKIIVISSIWPHGQHSTRAANIVIYEMLSALVNVPDIKVGLLVVEKGVTTKNGANEVRGIATLETLGVEILDPILLPAKYNKRARWKRFLSPSLVDWYPEYVNGSFIEKIINSWGADAVIVPWSEWLTHACSDVAITKFAYYGNPDPKAMRTQLRLRYQSGEISWPRKFLEDKMVNRFEKIHLHTMKKYELLGNVAKNDAEYYQRCGHKNAFYIQNLWIKSPLDFLTPPSSPDKPLKIIGNIGKLGSTANTLGIEYLGKKLLPVLEQIMNGIAFELHIFGSGSPHAIAANTFNNPKVIWRGFVENIDEELSNCDVFLCVNNATEYKVTHTRYLHAWSLSAPVVAHQDVALSMPEIRNEENALLGTNATEIALHIKSLALDKALRNKIKEGGYQTFKLKFTASAVVKQIIQKLSAYSHINKKNKGNFGER